jgi:hypothetical protein
MLPLMARIRPTVNPPQIRISPMSLVCPLCGAKPDYACETASGGRLEVIHVARIKAAAKRDAAMKAAVNKEQAR